MALTLADTRRAAAYEGEVIDDGDYDLTSLELLKAVLDSDNLVGDERFDEELGGLGALVVQEADIDESSRSEWRRRTESGMSMALQEGDVKTYPWPGAANVRYPLMTTAAMQFAARAYPAVIDGDKVVRGKITGEDAGQVLVQDVPGVGPVPAIDPNTQAVLKYSVEPGAKQERADRIAKFMSWQFLKQMKEWEPDTDRMLHALPIAGMAFRKTWFDQTKGRIVSVYVEAMKLIVNQASKSLETAPRITWEFELYPHEIQERINSGVFADFPYYGMAENGDDDSLAPHKFYEQYRRLDLDGDGYAEPVIVTVHISTERVCRVVAGFEADAISFNENNDVIRIEPKQYFTEFTFIPNPDGGFYGVGFGYLLTPINAAVNTVLNQMLDAGTLANLGGGFLGKGLRLKGGTTRFQPGEYKEVDATGGTVRDSIVPMTFPGPNPVLFQLLGMLIEAGREIASVKDILVGEMPAGDASPTTTLAVIEQGLKQFTAIYKRIYRSLDSEYQKVYGLNRVYLTPEEYVKWQTPPQDKAQVVAQDFQGSADEIIPVSDPRVVTDMQRMASAAALGQFNGPDHPWIDGQEIDRRIMAMMRVENPERLFKPPQGPSEADLAGLEVIKAEAAESKARAMDYMAKAQTTMQTMAMNMEKMQAEIVKLRADSIKALADAEAAEAGPQLAMYEAETDRLATRGNLAMGVVQHAAGREDAQVAQEQAERDREAQQAGASE